MLAYCNTSLYAEKINILNNMLNLENVQFQKYFFLVVTKLDTC